jgi:hypothetical protein
VTSPGYLVTWAAPLVALLSSLLIKLFTHTTPEITAARRRKQARGKAVTQLKKIYSSEPQKRHELLVSAMKQYIGERFDKVAGSLTGSDCYSIVMDNTADGKTAARFKDIVTDCETAYYTPAQSNIDAVQIKEVIELLRNIEKKSRK